MKTFLLLFLLSCLQFLSSQSYAILTIEITGGTEGGQPIAIVPFEVAFLGSVPENIASIITNDLQRSGRFVPTPAMQLPERPSQMGQVNFPIWQAVAIPHLVVGRISSNAGQGYMVTFELIDIFQNTQMIALGYPTGINNFRQVAHQISDKIYELLTGERGVFGTRIAYVTVKRSAGGGGTYRLNIADADGANSKAIFESREPILSPCWSRDGQRIAYVSFENKKTSVFIQDVRSGSRTQIASWQGLNTAPAWSPDGSRLALTLSKDGNPEIYVLSVYGRSLTRLTNNPAVDTEPDWSPDGSSLAFTSDRSGTPQIYMMSAGGGDTRRITFEGKYNARPRFSPDGSKLVLQHGETGGIALLDLSNSQLNPLTQSSLDESPSFAPNGSIIIFGSGATLSVISVDGRVRQRLAVTGGEEVREPAWSPFTN